VDYIIGEGNVTSGGGRRDTQHGEM